MVGDKIFENLDVFKLVRVWTRSVYKEFLWKKRRPVEEEKHMVLKNFENKREPSPKKCVSREGCRLDI